MTIAKPLNGYKTNNTNCKYIIILVKSIIFAENIFTLKQYTRSEVIKNINTYTQLVNIFENQKDYVAMERSKQNLLKYQNLLKQCKLK